MEYLDIDNIYDLEDELDYTAYDRVQSILDKHYDLYDLDGCINIDY